jgi:uncharacterized protein (UPF0261 family)
MRKIAISESEVGLANGQGLTAPCVGEARRRLEAAGFQVCVFPASGAGGQALEAAVAAGQLAGVLDVTLSELADELVGGLSAAGPDRLTAAGLRGLPQVVVPGAVDAVTFGPQEPIAEQSHVGHLCLVAASKVLARTTSQDNDRIGRDIALKTSAARGPVALLLPLRGLSALDREGEAFWCPPADAALFQSIRNWLAPCVRLIELDLHINDLEFARRAADVLLEMLSVGWRHLG